MTAYVREKLRDFMVATWPPKDATEHAFIMQCIQNAYHTGLLTTFDIQCGLRYCGGSLVRRNEENIQKFLSVMAELTNYTDVSFVETHYEHDSDIDKQVKVAMLAHKGLWE